MTARILNGTELAGFIKERQARQVRALRQAHNIFPKLVIIKSEHASPVIDTYVRMKRRYGDDILIETEVATLPEIDMPAAIEKYNNDPSVHGMIIQLPLDDKSKTDEIINLVSPEKDVDGLGSKAKFDSATAIAINWLIAGYGIDLKAKKVTIVGNGRLVGAPLAKIWKASGYDVTVLDSHVSDIAEILRASDVIITATGVPRLITTAMVPVGATVVDAGTASENGVIVGDIEPAIRERDDLKITPEKGGVGPLTITALFDNVIHAAQTAAEKA
ncbi:MAG TPA: bifunctional 5,10-methylenetetrahydrofolate dehydrogenase/5,10-methenyltetrahydrofolate cyclohydrolase [Candidatus Chromulinivoraceae bacterium]|nr:bifunctional 5,10-methylenetetrahydrofolate dehydrogenase/5,10-methenyltetrahydrofolate cyclohydrolase [Candidatus Chromulinivoraceae bacterium]